MISLSSYTSPFLSRIFSIATYQHNNSLIFNEKQKRSDKFNSKQNQTSSKDFDGSIIHNFITDIGYDVSKPLRKCPPDLLAAVQNRMAMYDFKPQYLIPVQKATSVALAVVYNSYPRFSLEFRVYLVMYTALAIYLDNMMQEKPEIMRPELQKVPAQFGLGVREDIYEDPVLYRWLQIVVLETPKHYGPYSTGAIVKGSLDYVIGCLMEDQVGSNVAMEFPKTAGRWPTFFREKTGMGEIYAHFLYPEETIKEEHLGTFLPAIPDIAMLINRVNDILSFYKEGVVGNDGCTYMLAKTKTTRRSAVEVLRRECQEQIALMKEVQATLSGVARVVFDEFMDGYVMFQGSNSRYRLNEIGVVLGGNA